MTDILLVIVLLLFPFGAFVIAVYEFAFASETREQCAKAELAPLLQESGMNVNDLIERLRHEAAISDRPGQFERLNALADEIAALRAKPAAPVEGEVVGWMREGGCICTGEQKEVWPRTYKDFTIPLIRAHHGDNKKEGEHV